MNPFSIRPLLTALFILAIQGGHALANPIYYDFSSQLSSVPKSVAQINYGTVNFTPTSSAGQGEASLNSSQGTHVAGSGSINIANLGWQIGSDPSNPGLTGSPSTFNSQSFGMALTLTDEASHAQGTLHFLGSFSGVVWNGGPLTFTPSIQTLQLGHNLYTVDLSNQTSWNTQNQTWMLMGASGGVYDVSAQVNVQPLSAPSAPEPTGLTLTGLGLVTTLGGGLRRCRRRKPSV